MTGDRAPPPSAPAARPVVPTAVRGPRLQPAHRRRVPGGARVVRRLLARAPAGTGRHRQCPGRRAAAVQRARSVRRGVPRPVVTATGAGLVELRARRARGRARGRGARGPARARALRPDPGLPVGQPLPARRAVRRPAARGRPRGPGHRQRADPDGRDARVPHRPRGRHRRPDRLGPARRGQRRRRAGDGGRAVRRGGVARPAHPPRPARARPRPRAAGRAGGGAPRCARADGRPPAPRRSGGRRRTP